MTQNPQKIVVYRSQMEQIQDEFWMAHPEIALMLAGLVVALLAAFFIKFVWDYYSFNKFFNKDWKKQYKRFS